MEYRWPMRKLGMRLIVAGLISALVTSSPSSLTAAPEPDEIVKLEVSPNIQWEPGIIKLKITVQSHVDNIQLCMGYTYKEDPPELQPLRRSCQQLNGIYSPRVYWIEYKSITFGEYFAFAEVIRVPHRLASKAQANFIVTPR